jgi:hypothetical protein
VACVGLSQSPALRKHFSAACAQGIVTAQQSVDWSAERLWQLSIAGLCQLCEWPAAIRAACDSRASNRRLSARTIKELIAQAQQLGLVAEVDQLCTMSTSSPTKTYNTVV